MKLTYGMQVDSVISNLQRASENKIEAAKQIYITKRRGPVGK